MTVTFTTDPLASARELAPLVEAEADATEAAGTLSPAVVQALAERGLFGLLVPSELGGMEADAATTLAVYEELCRADPSTGWSFLANTCTSGFAGAFCGDAAVAAMFPPGKVVSHAGMLGPRGSAVPEDGGYRVSGRFSFGSGSGHADWIGAGTIVAGPDGPLMGANGLPELRVAFLPRHEVEFLGNWDVLGLQGTGSFDYEVKDRFVADDFTFSVMSPTIHRGGAVYRLGVLGLTSVGHCGFALGVAQRALEEAARVAPSKVRMSSFTAVSDDRLFQYDFAHHEAAFRSVRAYSYELFEQADSVARTGADPDAELQLRLRQVTTYATHVAADVVRAAFGWLGTDGIRPTVIQRLLRDVQTAAQHIFVDSSTFCSATPALLASYQRSAAR
ncbi:MAG: acyl-CoA dehydrogenase family protein [Acidobacteriota bacterium]|nr:acyl-CoA dehydrogenase family protein [Acidobacteriota bacterium]